MTEPTARPERPAPRAGTPYADAPRLPDGDAVRLDTLVTGSRYELEIGPGRGVFIQERARAFPDVGLVGVEVRRKWASIVDARIAKEGLASRARVFAGDATSELRRLAPDASLTVVYLHFPDPWWKKRHAKRIVLQEPLLDEVARLLTPGGELYVQTDVPERRDQYAKLLERDARFEPAGDEAGSPAMADNPYGARSPREKRAIADGLPVYRLRWRRLLG